MRLALATVLMSSAVSGAALAEHACDDLGAKGWRSEATVETVATRDSTPYRSASGAWYIERSITEIPFCHYFNTLGNYSLRSYSLSPETRTERVEICRGSEVVIPYNGQCPPG